MLKSGKFPANAVPLEYLNSSVCACGFGLYVRILQILLPNQTLLCCISEMNIYTSKLISRIKEP